MKDGQGYIPLIADRCNHRLLDLLEWIDYREDPWYWLILLVPLGLAFGYCSVQPEIVSVITILSLAAAVVIFVATCLLLLAVKLLTGVLDVALPRPRLADRSFAGVIRGRP